MKTFKELFAGTGIEPTTDENGGVHYNFNATLKTNAEASDKAIELPSDEDIENIMISKYPHSVGVGVNHLIKSDERIGFEEGAKWMKEQILNQKK